MPPASWTMSRMLPPLPSLSGSAGPTVVPSMRRRKYLLSAAPAVPRYIRNVPLGPVVRRGYSASGIATCGVQLAAVLMAPGVHGVAGQGTGRIDDVPLRSAHAATNEVGSRCTIDGL